MFYQVIYRDVSHGAFVLLRQTGYASIHIRRTAAARSSRLPLNYTRKSGSYISLRSLGHIEKRLMIRRLQAWRQFGPLSTRRLLLDLRTIEYRKRMVRTSEQSRPQEIRELDHELLAISH
jgi:hypothetical protein